LLRACCDNHRGKTRYGKDGLTLGGGKLVEPKTNPPQKEKSTAEKGLEGGGGGFWVTGGGK